VRLFRRKARDPELAAAREAFRRAAVQLDSAQLALLAAVPTARHPGVPLADALARFLGALDRADALMPAWRIPATEDAWQRCSAALTEARAQARRLRDERGAPDELGFEALNARLGEIISPLEEFADWARDLGK
jgi:hypothetical protein